MTVMFIERCTCNTVGRLIVFLNKVSKEGMWIGALERVVILEKQENKWEYWY